MRLPHHADKLNVWDYSGNSGWYPRTACSPAVTLAEFPLEESNRLIPLRTLRSLGPNNSATADLKPNVEAGSVSLPAPPLDPTGDSRMNPTPVFPALETSADSIVAVIVTLLLTATSSSTNAPASALVLINVITKKNARMLSDLMHPLLWEYIKHPSAIQLQRRFTK